MSAHQLLDAAQTIAICLLTAWVWRHHRQGTTMNRAQRRAAARAPRNPDVCEHGNWKKTDGNGNPMCPHGCGFKPEDRTNQRYQDAINYARTHDPLDRLQCDYCLPDGDCDTVAIATRWCGLAKLFHAARAHTDPTPGDPPPPPHPHPMA